MGSSTPPLSTTVAHPPAPGRALQNAYLYSRGNRHFCLELFCTTIILEAMGNYIASVTLGLVRRGRPLRAIGVLGQRAMDEALPQRQLVMSKRLDAHPAPESTPWRADLRPAEVVAAHFPGVSSDSTEAFLIRHDGVLAGYCYFKDASRLDRFYLDLPVNARYLSHIGLSESARGIGFAGAFDAVLRAIHARGVDWIVLSTNDWNVPMQRACVRAGFQHIGIARRRKNGSRAFRASGALPWIEPGRDILEPSSSATGVVVETIEAKLGELLPPSGTVQLSSLHERTPSVTP